MSTLLNDYLTIDNVQLYKGQHVQILNRLNSEYYMVQLLNSAVDNTSQTPKQVIEVQVPISLIKTRTKPNTDGKLNAYFLAHYW